MVRVSRLTTELIGMDPAVLHELYARALDIFFLAQAFSPIHSDTAFAGGDWGSPDSNSK
jgi:hypothetical protein